MAVLAAAVEYVSQQCSHVAVLGSVWMAVSEGWIREKGKAAHLAASALENEWGEIRSLPYQAWAGLQPSAKGQTACFLPGQLPCRYGGEGTRESSGNWEMRAWHSSPAQHSVGKKTLKLGFETAPSSTWFSWLISSDQLPAWHYLTSSSYVLKQLPAQTRYQH